MNKTAQKVLADNLDNPMLRQVLVDNALQHRGHYIAKEPPYCPGYVFCFPHFHSSMGDERTPELDRVIAQEKKEISKAR